MRLWIDDCRPAPTGYIWVKSVNAAKEIIEATKEEIEILNIDHDAGYYAYFGGDYIELLNWLEETDRNYPICIHSQNPVGIANMRRIIDRNGWTEVF